MTIERHNGSPNGRPVPLSLTTGRSASIDTLRGLAILGVVAVHAIGEMPSGVAVLDRALKMGRYGVQLFFMASAVTMMMTWQQRHSQSATGRDAVDFYIRRVARIMPMYWVAILVYVAVNGIGPSFFAPDGLTRLDIFLNAIAAHAWWPTATNSVVQGGWSIGVEMTFYLIFPLLVDRLRSLSSAVWAAVLAGIVFLVVRPLFASLLTTYFPGFSPDAQYALIGWLVPRQLIFFFIAIGAFILLNFGCRAQFSRPALIGTPIAAVTSYLALGRGESIVAVCLATLMYVVLRWRLAASWLSRLGQASYSVYLVHFLVVTIAAHWLLKFDLPNIQRALMGFLLVLLGSWALASVTKRLIEEPGIAIGRRFAAKWADR